MEKSHDSSESKGACGKICGAFSDCPIRCFLSPRPRDSRPASTTPYPPLPNHNHPGRTVDIQTKQAAHEHPKLVESSKNHDVPIEFDYSSPHSTNVKGKSATPHLPIQNISPVKKFAPMKEDNYKPPLLSVQENPMVKRQNSGQGVKATSEVGEKHNEPKLEAPAKALTGEKPGGDVNDRFTDYINRAKKIIRTVTNVGGGGHNTPEQDHVNDTKSKDNAKDHFSEYINRAKKKIRTTSGIGNGRNVSFKRE